MPKPSGFGAFTIMWVGQLLSALGTRMTNFALSIWVWQHTGSATAMALMMFCGFGSTVLFSPIAGSLIDKWSRKTSIIVSEIGSIAVTFILLALFLTDSTELWHLYLVNVLTGALLAIQGPAFGATIALMMEKGKFLRANAMMWSVKSFPVIFAPAFAATLLGLTGIKLILLIDGLTYVAAIITVLVVTIPRVPGQDREKTTFWQDCVFGFRYIVERPPLLAVQIVLFSISLLAALAWALIVPLVLARTLGDEGTLGLVQSIGAVGGVLGGTLLAFMRPPRRKMLVVLGAILVFSIVGRILYGVGDGLIAWAAAMFFVELTIPFIDGLAQTIWQEKVDPAVQGRVFAARNFFENLSVPIGFAAAGPLVDKVLEPAMRGDTALADTFGWLVGTGPGSGIGLLFVVVGVLGAGVGVAGFLSRNVREVETLVPDHEPEPEVKPLDRQPALAD
ncbi:Major Facilitator Superfamily protein [Lentzea waywayandensis]|uniref:Major Facilitator Superfamily protein n=1 Tax=Lentzea waywayandensis TaxID=84724 RepID=A0A1I6D2D8_9PSEU|nr:MFS transporter [Lentzea waywayandensis]SFQ99457.1 Major Facilitator Superfamily protein [Lentzea waywayandensis]